MKEIQEILNKLLQIGANEKAILATVVALEGSGYRRPGARMLVDENGYSIGTVSGGCLEADVLERAKTVLQTGKAEVITYDTTKDENSVFGLGMGCRGIVRVLLESVGADKILLEAFQRAVEKREKNVVATLISTNGDLPVGGRVFFDGSGKLVSQNLSAFLQNFGELHQDCRQLFDGKENSLNKTYELKNDFDETQTLEFFIEKIAPPLSLKLFGAGYDAVPLADFAEKLGWRVTVIDHRAAWANAERFPDVEKIIVARAEELDEEIFADENSVAVVMTHNYERDSVIIPRLLQTDFLYVGALGPKRRTEKLLAETDENFTDEQLKKLHAPIGLDIGAKTPEEIALAIVAEIQAVLSERNGGFLRLREGSIYERK